VPPVCAACPPQPSLAVPPSRALPLLSPSLVLYLTSADNRVPPRLFPNPQRRRDALSLTPLLMAVGRTCRGASGHPRMSLGHPRAWAEASGGRDPPLTTGAHPDGQNQPAQASLSLCCKCMFQVFQAFQRYVAIISYGCCKSRSRMFAHVASVLETYCNCLFKMFHLFKSYVASILI